MAEKEGAAMEAEGADGRGELLADGPLAADAVPAAAEADPGASGAGAPLAAEGATDPAWPEEMESYLQSKYTLVSVTAKRARQLLAGSPPRVQTLSEKPVTIALEELAQGKLYFEPIRDDTQ